MGVKGLWTLIEPAGQPVRMETLGNRVLAVDASIWLYQFVKAVRDKEGNVIHNAHLMGFFRRICRLLYFNIKPVFVFDGGAPLLKMKTLAERRRRREQMEIDLEKTAARLLETRLKMSVLDAAPKKPGPEGGRYRVQQSPGRGAKRNTESKALEWSRKRSRMDPYALPPVPDDAFTSNPSQDPRLPMLPQEFADFDSAAVQGAMAALESRAFRSLSLESQHQIIMDLRMRSRHGSDTRLRAMLETSDTALDFSKAQIRNLVHRNRITQKWIDVLGMDDKTVTPRRVAADRLKQYVLVKNDGKDGSQEGGWKMALSREKYEIEPMGRENNDEGSPTEKWDGLFVAANAAVDEDSDDSPEAFEEARVMGHSGQHVLDPSEIRHSPEPVPNTDHVDSDEDFEITLAKIRSLEDSDSSPVSPECVNSKPLNTSEAFLRHWRSRIPSNVSLLFPNTWGDMEAQLRHQSIAQTRQTAKALMARKKEQPQVGLELDFLLLYLNAVVEFKEMGVQPLLLDQGQRTNSLRPRATSVTVPSAPSNSVRRRGSIETRMILEADSSESLVSPDTLDPSSGPADPLVSSRSSSPIMPAEPVVWPGQGQPPGAGSVFVFPGSDSSEYEEDDLFVEVGSSKAVRSCGTGPEIGVSDIREETALDLTEAKLVPNPTSASLETRNTRHSDAGVDSGANPTDAAVMSLPGGSMNSDEVELSDGPMKTRCRGDGEEQFPCTNEIPGPESMPAKGKARSLAGWDPPDTGQHVPVDGNQSQRFRPQAKDSILPASECTATRTSNQVESSPTSAVNPPNSRLGTEFEGSDSSNAPDSLMLPSSPRQVGRCLGENELDYSYYTSDDEDPARHARQQSATATTSFVRDSAHGGTCTRQDQRHLERNLSELKAAQAKARRDAAEVTQDMVREVQEMLSIFGIPYITARMEAEAQCAYLSRRRVVEGIITDDSDVFLFGGNKIYKDMFSSNKTVMLYDTTNIDRRMRLDRKKMISLAQLLGSDYAVGVKGIGVVTAMDIISEFPGEDSLKQLRLLLCESRAQSNWSPRKKKIWRLGKRLSLPDPFPDPEVLRAYYNPSVDEFKDWENFAWGEPDMGRLYIFMKEKLGWSQSRVDEVLVPVIKHMELTKDHARQRTLGDFFQISGQPGVIPSSLEKGARRVVLDMAADEHEQLCADEELVWQAAEEHLWLQEKRSQHTVTIPTRLATQTPPKIYPKKPESRYSSAGQKSHG